MSDLLARARDQIPLTLDLIATLAAIDTGTGQVKGIGRAWRVLASELRQLGFAVQSIPAGEYGRHLLAHRPGKGRPILFLGHLDTVFPSGTARKPDTTGDRLSGPGVYDCKGGLALCIAAFRLWNESGWPTCPIEVLFNADEEVGSLSSRPVIEEKASRARAGLVVEPAPALDRVITARKGIGRYVLRVFGRAAHSGTDRAAGISALVELAAKIIALGHLNADGGGYSVTVGTATGGVRPNVVPDYAQAEIDLRVSQADQVAVAESALRSAAAVSQVPGAECRLDGGITRPPMPETDESRRLFALARQVGSSLGLDLAPAASGGGSDANFCAAVGLPVLDGLGPAGAGAHAEHEHLLISSLAPRIALLSSLGLRLGELPE